VDREQAWRVIDNERQQLADLLDTLTDEEWAHPSLCEGWTVRDVAAHVISSPQVTVGSLAVALLRARGDFDRCMRDVARRSAARPTGEIVADYRRLAGSRRRPPGTSVLDPLLDVLVHTQDIVVPLGRRHPMPVAAARACADHVWTRSFPFEARRKLRGFRLTATDVRWAVGEGPAVTGPIGAIVLLLTGRPAGLAQLDGEGAAELAARVGDAA